MDENKTLETMAEIRDEARDYLPLLTRLVALRLASAQYMDTLIGHEQSDVVYYSVNDIVDQRVPSVDERHRALVGDALLLLYFEKYPHFDPYFDGEEMTMVRDGEAFGPEDVE